MELKSRYIKKMNETILIASTGISTGCSNYEMSMLQNDIPGILPATKYEEDGMEEYCFNCTGYVVFSDFFTECKLDTKLFKPSFLAQ